MIYDSLDIIPAKIFFRIQSSGDLFLLTDQNKSEQELKTIWELLESEHNEINPNKDENRSLNIFRKMEELSSKYESIKLAVHHLKNHLDLELVDLLKSYNYKFTNNINKDLSRIERESKAFEVKISRIQSKLPKEKEEDKSVISFDQVVLSYSSLVGSGFVDTNSITITQYYALVNIGNQKLKALENGQR